MKIDIYVKDRLLTVTSEDRLPSGGINDVQCKFTFEDGYGWDEIPHITAVFARETKWAFQTEIRPDTYFYVPASIISRSGTVYISLYGCTNDGIKVVQTTTAVVLVEPNALNRNSCIIFPVDSYGEYDTDAYAQYVASVNSAAVRAEEAARKLEDVVIGSYTKSESDARYIQKMYLSSYVTNNDFTTEFITTGTKPSIRKYGITPVCSEEASYSNPGSIYGISSVIVSYIGTNDVVNTTFTGYGELFYLSSKTFDYIDIVGDSVTLHRNSNTLNLKNATTSWVSDSVLRVSLTNENAIKEDDLTSIYTNMGEILKEATKDYIDLFIPRGTDLTNAKIVYPLATEYSALIQTTGLPATRNNTDLLKVYVKTGADDPTEASSYIITVEANIAGYITHYKNKVDTLQSTITNLQTKYTALEARVKALEEQD